MNKLIVSYGYVATVMGLTACTDDTLATVCDTTAGTICGYV